MNKVVKVTITKTVNFGAFCDADIDGTVYKGLIHISEIADKYVSDVNEFVSVGQTVDGYVISVDEANKQAKISLKRV
ncbi:S1 RNA-binding domain-containing protein [Spiroplasma turonicum]|uniref:S1 motif domain-containing protein n=1 Tax=Spiroplasma turonicum TaxID=216946 RepID=A0A0K1P6D8_9MOLU|nr:S1 RNA-binding domain-containing protein [Spiroplasma turonicum]AKU79764.1 hypothetical protein STURON_00518 [Spiroplasma turonicum]ALX70782.1 hypothetical protein STURO_v1c05160 [Spiroplasma turonicum]